MSFDMKKFKYLDVIANDMLIKILKLDLTELETQYILNEIFKYNFRLTNNKIKRMRNDRIDELKKIAYKE